MVKPVTARGLHNLVVQQLGRLIVSGELAPGEGLPREEDPGRALERQPHRDCARR